MCGDFMVEKEKKGLNILFMCLPFVMGMVLNIFISIIGMVGMMVYFIITRQGDFTESYEFVMGGNQLILITVLFHLSMIIGGGLWYKFAFVKKNKIEYSGLFQVKHILGLLVAGVALQFSLAFLLNIILPLFPNLMEQYMNLMDNIQIEGNVLSVLLTCIIAPISEELIFRGLVLGYGKKALPFLWVNIIQALMFGIYHMNFVQGTYAFFLGLILGLVAMKYKSIIASIFLHMVINASSYLVGVVFPEEGGVVPAGTEIIIFMVGIVLSVVFLYILMRKKDNLSLE